MTQAKMTSEMYAMFQAAGVACARIAVERWGVGFTRLDTEQKKAEVCRQVCAFLFENHSNTQTAVLRLAATTAPTAATALRALLDAGLSPDAQQVIYQSALNAREATWGLS